MPRWTIVFSVVVAVIAMLFLMPAKARSEDDNSKINAVELTQTHSVLGDTDLIISMIGMRMQNKGRMGFTLVAGAPDWRVTVFRDDDKTYYAETLEQFESSGLYSDMISNRYDRQWQSTAPTTKFRFFLWTARRTSGRGRLLEYLPLTGICAPQIERIMYAAFKTPTNGGVTLLCSKTVSGKDWLSGLSQEGDKRVLLSTSAAKAVTVSKTIFRAPTCYKAVKAIQQVMSSTESRHGAEDMDDLFEMGADARKKNKLIR
jgi:hypothetical protein